MSHHRVRGKILFQVYLAPDHIEELRVLAEARAVSQADVMREAIEWYAVTARAVLSGEDRIYIENTKTKVKREVILPSLTYLAMKTERPGK